MNGHPFIWLGVIVCLSQSAMFSGLNLALFGISRLRLEVAADGGNPMAARLLAFRKDSNFLLATILWGNVGVNVLLTLLSDSVLAGVSAFLFSTVVITLFGEIAPQAYFSRNALRIGNLLAPVLRVYQTLLYPVARPTAAVLDFWLGQEDVQYFREADLKAVIHKHVASSASDVGRVEGVGAVNFLAIDDLSVSQEGEPVDPSSIISLPHERNLPVFPTLTNSPADPFVRRIHVSGKKWIIITTLEGEPSVALNSDEFLRAALFGSDTFNPYVFCHRPVIVRDRATPIEKVLSQLKVLPEHAEDDVIDQDIILLWADEKRIITGADILGRLLRGIVRKQEQR